MKTKAKWQPKAVESNQNFSHTFDTHIRQKRSTDPPEQNIKEESKHRGRFEPSLYNIVSYSS